MTISARHIAMACAAGLDVTIMATVVPLFGAVAAANVFIVVLMIKALVFVVLYGTRSAWRSTSGGRAVMALIACIGTICGVGAVNSFATDYPGRPIVRLVAFIAVGMTLMNLLLTLIEEQRNSSDRTDE